VTRPQRFRRGRTLGRFARPYTRRAIVAAFTLIVATAAAVAGPLAAKEVIDRGIRTGDYNRVVLWVAVFLVVVMAGWIATEWLWTGAEATRG